MKAFDLDHHLVENWDHFFGFFSTIRASDLKGAISIHGRFWPGTLFRLPTL